jgi:hypothetical protein
MIAFCSWLCRKAATNLGRRAAPETRIYMAVAVHREEEAGQIKCEYNSLVFFVKLGIIRCFDRGKKVHDLYTCKLQYMKQS